MILKKATPSRWIAFIAVSWGVVATFTGMVQNFAGLVVCRLLLGLFEGGLFPGLAIYLTFFYTKKELALRIGYLFVCAALSGSVGGLLAFAIGYMDGVGGYRGWRWVFILEGIPTTLLGVATIFLLPNNPDSASFLSSMEKEILKARISRQVGFTRSGMEFSKADALKAITDWKVIVFCLAQFGGGAMLYGYSTFLPTIIKTLGNWSVPQTQALTTPCYALGAITYIIVAVFSDRQQRRGIYVLICGAISMVGYAVLLANVAPGVKYLGCFLIAMGLYVVLGIPLSWLPTRKFSFQSEIAPLDYCQYLPVFPRYGKRTTATGLQLAVSNFAGILVPYVSSRITKSPLRAHVADNSLKLYPTKDGPRYILGNAVTLGLLAFAISCATGMSLYFSLLNARRAAGKEDHKLAGKTNEEVDEMGDDSPRFTYTP